MREPSEDTLPITMLANDPSLPGTRPMDCWYPSPFRTSAGWTLGWISLQDFRYPRVTIVSVLSFAVYRKNGTTSLVIGETTVLQPKKSSGFCCGIYIACTDYPPLSSRIETLDSYPPFGKVCAKDYESRLTSLPYSTPKRTVKRNELIKISKGDYALTVITYRTTGQNGFQ